MSESQTTQTGLMAGVTQSAIMVDGASYFRAVYRAAIQAQRSILIAGWQFDPYIRLLYGDEAEMATYPVNLWELLNALCRERPELRVCILAWDYSLVYAFERSWLEMMRARLAAHQGIQFRWRSHPDPRGSHHQKLVVVDGSVAFAGGLDLGSARWDTRDHDPEHPHRSNGWGGWHKPFHDVQAAVRGPAAQALQALFWQAWHSEDVEGTPPPGSASGDHPSSDAFELGELCGCEAFLLPAREVVISQTAPPREQSLGLYEVRSMLELLIDRAERSIYIENQYFTSSAVVRALLARMAAPDRPRLSVVLLLPDGADSAKEQFALGTLQDEALSAVTSTGRKLGHRVAIYHTATENSAGSRVATYIHSKLMIIDDVTLLVGSANLTNRSMGLDTELSLTFNVDADTSLKPALTALRASLLAEHVGSSSPEPFVNLEGLDQRLERLAAAPDSKLYASRIQAPATAADTLAAAIFDPHTVIDDQDWDRIWEATLGLDEDSALKRSWEAFKQALLTED